MMTSQLALLALLLLAVPGLGEATFMTFADSAVSSVPIPPHSTAPGFYANVSVSAGADGTTALLAFSRGDNFQGTLTYFIGGIALNLSQPVSVTNVSSFVVPGWTVGGPVNTEFGSFSVTVNQALGFAGTYLFHTDLLLTNLGTPWGSGNPMLVPNAFGAEVAAHVYVCVTPYNSFEDREVGICNPALFHPDPFHQLAADGYVSNIAPVPEPSTLILGGTALLMGIIAWRRRVTATRATGVPTAWIQAPPVLS